MSTARTINRQNVRNGGDEDLSDYKYMLRQEGAYEESTHPDDFLGDSQRADPSLSPKRRGKNLNNSVHSAKSVHSAHKWGAPEKPEQFRPDDWLGGSSHHSKRSWTPKSAMGNLETVGSSKAEQILALLPTVNLDDEDEYVPDTKSVDSTAKSTSGSLSTNSSHHERRQALRDSGHKPQPKRWKAQRSHSVGPPEPETKKQEEPIKVVRTKFEDTSNSGAPVMPVRLPSCDTDIVIAQAELAEREAEREVNGEPVTPNMKGKRSTVSTNPKKFNSVPYDAYSVRTEAPVTPTKTAPPPRAMPEKVQSFAHRRAQAPNGVLEEEKINTKKFTSAFAMFENSPGAEPRKYQSAQPKSSGDGSGMYKPRTEQEKEAARAKRSAHRQQKRSKANQARHATMTTSNEPTTPVGTPRRIQSLISPRYNVPRNFSVSKEALLKSRQLSLKPLHDKPKTQDQYLQGIIAQLRKVQLEKKQFPGVQNEAEELMEMIHRLRHVDQSNKKLNAMLKPLEDQEGEPTVEQLQSVLDNLEAMQDPNASRLAEEDHDWLESALRRLKKVQLTPREAEGVANTVRQLKHVDLSDVDGEAESDALIAKLNQTTLVYPQRKVSEVNQALNGLRRIPLNDQQREDFAKKILGLAVQRPYVDELSDAILRLRKANLNKWEAKQAAGIAMDLRKTLRNILAGVEDDEEEDDEDSVYSRLTRKELRQHVDKKKMDEMDDVFDKLKACISKVTDKEMDDFCKALEGVGKSDPTREQARHQEYVDMLADAIRNLKHAKLNRWEANEVHGIVVNLRKTNFPKREGEENQNGINRRMAELCNVTSPETMSVIEDVVKKVTKAVRFNLNDEIFEFFLDDIIATGHGEPTKRQLEYRSQCGPRDMQSSDEDDDISYDELKDDGDKTEAEDGDEDDVQSVNTMAISISSAEISLSEEEVELTDDEEEAEKEELSPRCFHHPFPRRTSQSCPASPASEDPANRRIVFTRKHHWQHKKHNVTVVGEKRWRLCENFATDEVIFSPLSREQHNRRKAIDGALKGALGCLDLGSSSRSLGAPPSTTDTNRLQPGSNIFDDEAGSDLEDETHVSAVERRLQENNINLCDLIKYAESSKKAVVLTPSPKRAARRLHMDSQPMTDLPF